MYSPKNFIFNYYNKHVTLLIETLLDQNLPIFIKNKNNYIVSHMNSPSLFLQLQKPIKTQVHMFLTNIYLCYIIENQYYVDINHIISNLNRNSNNTINYQRTMFIDFSKYVSQTIYTLGINGQITRRDLINCNIMEKIMVCECQFSRLFRLEFTLYIFTLCMLIFYIFLVYCYYYIFYDT